HPAGRRSDTAAVARAAGGARRPGGDPRCRGAAAETSGETPPAPAAPRKERRMTPTPTIVIMTEEEVSRCVPADDEPGFGALSTERGPLPLKAMAVHARIDGLLADVTLAQTFVNTHAEPLEATYICPLPDRAAVTR